MSSNYQVICLSHDPALVIDTGWADRATLEGHLAAPKRSGVLAQHATCDLLGGAYSYPLVEVYCPPTREVIRGKCYHPHHGTWIDAAWLRLLLAARKAARHGDGGPSLLDALNPMSICWSEQRLSRLAVELGAVVEDQQGTS